MFGHDDEDKKDEATTIAPIKNTPGDGDISADATGTANTPPAYDETPADGATAAVSNSDSQTTSDPLIPPIDNNDKENAPPDLATNSSEETNYASVKSVPIDDSDDDSAKPDEPATIGLEDHDLLEIKKEALQDLSPLVDQLDQTPAEKFRTTMMMIQASDDQALVKRAYEAAKTITDDKEKAQALLDIVNEINYFTQPNSN